MSDLNQFVALRLVLPGWPTNIVAIPPQIDHIGLADLETSAMGSSSLIANGTVQILEDIIIDLPLIPGLSLALFNNGNFTELDFEIEYLPDWFEVALKSLSASLRIQSDLLKRMEALGTTFVEAPPDPETGAPQPVEIMLEGVDISLNSNGEFRFTFADGAPALTIPPFMVGDSGIVVDIQRLQLILSEETAASLPGTMDPSSRGVLLEEAGIHFPEGLSDILPSALLFEDAFIGSGGFSGSVTLDLLEDDGVDAYDENNAKSVFGFGFTLQMLTVQFLQNTLAGCEITGFLKVPFFEEALKVTFGITNDGEIVLALGAPGEGGLFILEKEGIISVEVNSLEFLSEGTEYELKLTGKFTPLIAGFQWPAFELQGLSISTSGQVKVEGGWIELPAQKALDFGGFKVEISKLGFGSEEVDSADYKWVGFSGGVQIVEAIPLSGGVEGLKVMWSAQGPPLFRLGGASVSYEQENVGEMSGFAYFIDNESAGNGSGETGLTGKGFKGGATFNLVPLNFSVDCQFIAGRDDDYAYFYIFIDVELPVGLPIIPPFIGLYGLAGLFGYNMNLDYAKLIDYEGEGARPDMTDVGSEYSQWYNEKGALALGAGVTIGTLPDVKFTAALKTLFVVLIPGPVLLIEGHASMISLGGNYPYRVLAVLDPTAGVFLCNITAEYDFPKNSGALVDALADADGSFPSGDPGGWYLNLGRKNPEDQRVRADILDFFTAESYLMINSQRILMGAWIGYGLDERFGILRVILEAWITGELNLSASPFQANATLTLYGNAELSAGLVSLGISAEANVSAEAPKPVAIAASLEVQLKTPLGKPKATISITWEKEGVPPYPVPLAASLGIEHNKVSLNWDVQKRSAYPVDDDNFYPGGSAKYAAIPPVPLVPPDVRLVLNFDKAVLDAAMLGDNPAPAPANESAGAYEFKYSLDSVTLQCRDEWIDESVDDDNWEDYEAFANSQVESGDIETPYKLSGAWQLIPDGAEIANKKLVLNASTPFEISRLLNNSSIWTYPMQVLEPDYPCTPVPEEKWTCVDFDSRATGEYFRSLIINGFLFIGDFPLFVAGFDSSWLGTRQALTPANYVDTINCLNISHLEPEGNLQLKVIDNAIFTAGAGYDSHLSLVKTGPFRDTRLHIDVSETGVGKLPALISFPELLFEGTGSKFWVRCSVQSGSGTFLYGYDEQLNKVASADLAFDGDQMNTYLLDSSGPLIRWISIHGEGIVISDVCFSEIRVRDQKKVIVVMPADMTSAEVYFSAGSNGEILLYDREETEIERISFDIPRETPDTEMHPVSVEVAGRPFRSMLVCGENSDYFHILRVCGLTVEAAETHAYNSSIYSHLTTATEENWGQHSNKILHPGKFYRLEVKTTASRRKGSGGEWSPAEFTEYMYFKTGNPPGPASELQLVLPDADRYDKGELLNGLAPYIDYTIPAGATAGVAQKRVYRSYDIGMVYNESYIDQMYQMAGIPIRIIVLDNNNRAASDLDGNTLELLNRWGDNPDAVTTREEIEYKELLDAASCIPIQFDIVGEYKEELTAYSRDLLLTPRIQHRARVLAGDMPVYEFAFITSSYANFRHHIHSFSDKLWDHFELLNNPHFDIDIVILEQILANSEIEHVKFEQLMILFDLNPRQLPERVELTLMNDQDRSYGLLLESPEPFEWDRLELGCTFADTGETIEEFDKLVKITGGSVSEDTQQFVEILLMETTDLSGMAIEYRSMALEDDEAYNPYYLFPEGSRYPAGTSLLIFDGREPAEAEDEIEQVAIYADHLFRTFPADGVDLRIIDADGELLHQRELWGDGIFAELDHTLIRNEDGTRLFCFFKDMHGRYTSLREGIYRLEFTYLRDIGSPFPVLKRFGFADAETTFVTFSFSAA